MSQFRIRNVVLPAVLVASGVFSTLTLPFIMNQPAPAWMQPPSFLEEEPSLVFDRENRDAAIRYVGGAIVVSVGAGIATIEILRRLHPSNRLSKAQKDAINLQIRKLESTGESNPAQLAENVEQTISMLAAEESKRLSSRGLPKEKVAGRAAGQQSSVERWSDDVLAATNSAVGLDELPAQSQALNLEDDIPVRWLEPEPPEQAPLNQDAIRLLDQPFETHRVNIPDRHHTLLAISVNGRYFSLFRTHPQLEAVEAIAAKLQQQGDQTVLTRLDQRYAVWVLQPDAYIELVS
ncbi:hypothetical protein IFO70_03280 [Phormidium tenue FACHB-886]|nr:hypothetical protein [Phormidium tenue FACHB-886]